MEVQLRLKGHPSSYTYRQGNDVVHIKVQNTGDYYDLYGGERFATLEKLVNFYVENPGSLRDNKKGNIDLISPLNFDCEVTNERFVIFVSS